MESTNSLDLSHSSILNEITKGCEKLITETQRDLEIFRHEQQALQQKIFEIQEENNRINSKVEVLKNSSGETKDDATREKLNQDAVRNAMQQIEYLKAENKDLKTIIESLKKTNCDLEEHIKNYRNQFFNQTSAGEATQKYSTVIKLLEGTIVNQKSELKEQRQTIDGLIEQKRQLKGIIEHLQNSIKEKDHELSKYSETKEAMNKLQEQLTESTDRNRELQKSLKNAKNSLEERLKREQSALQKVQEALAIAETAVADKEEALKREKVVKEECDNIASTIGQVMDEAARKVEKDMEAIRKNNMDKEKTLIEEKAKLEQEIINQRKLNENVNARFGRFEQKYKDVLRENEKLSQQLEMVTKTIYEMERKLNQQEKTCQKSNKNSEKNQDEQEMEIKYYMETNKQLQERYRVTLHDMTKSFEEHINQLLFEVANLKAENNLLKTRTSSSNSRNR